MVKWNPDADIRLFMVVLKVHNISVCSRPLSLLFPHPPSSTTNPLPRQIDNTKVAHLFGHGATPKAIKEHILKLRIKVAEMEDLTGAGGDGDVEGLGEKKKKAPVGRKRKTKAEVEGGGKGGIERGGGKATRGKGRGKKVKVDVEKEEKEVEKEVDVKEERGEEEEE
ncbi:hypothetical protein EX30DRAFT_375014 [Ascodesmis nigricans]|uniref:Uncharacterized protein n=1 Tax=Ascodesmis nigricans TaxID=341454 RepID=A0A4S2MR21_9PEZI|nr:hypothetical protein EX30DRAFT_375014 [Ascodesmis nigricans]